MNYKAIHKNLDKDQFVDIDGIDNSEKIPYQLFRNPPLNEPFSSKTKFPIYLVDSHLDQLPDFIWSVYSSGRYLVCVNESLRNFQISN